MEYRVSRYCFYGSCAIVSSELLYYLYCRIKKILIESSSSEEVCEVIWTNELTQSCALSHGIYYGKDAVSRNNSSNNTTAMGNFFKKLNIFSSNKECKNAFCASRNIGRLIEFIDSCKYSIDLAMYTFTSFELSEAFVRALKRGVLIRIVSDREMAYSTGSRIIFMTRAGVPIRCNKNPVIMHHKFCIIDSPQRVAEILKKQKKKVPDGGQSKSMLLTGSLNWTNQGFAANYENILITNNLKHINKYVEEFERMWNKFDVDLTYKVQSSHD